MWGVGENSIGGDDVHGPTTSRTGGLANTRVYKEVAMAKLTTKQNPIYLWWLWGIWEGRGTTRTWWGSCSNPRTRPHGLRHDTRADGPKNSDTTPYRFWTSTCFDESRCLRYDFDIRPIPLEALWNFLSNHITNVPNRVCMRSWQPLQVISIHLLAKSDVDVWWRTWGTLGLGPQ
jgi:hypothetical protein